MHIQDISGKQFCCAKCGGQEVSTTGNPKFVTCDKCGGLIDAHNAMILGQVIPLKNYTSKVSQLVQPSPNNRVSPDKNLTSCPRCLSASIDFVEASRPYICRACESFFTEQAVMLSNPFPLAVNFPPGSLEQMVNPTLTRKSLVAFLNEDD